MPSPFALIAGVGPGTGAAVARQFAKAYPVVLLARTEASYSGIVNEINSSGGKAVGISTDVSSPESLQKAKETIDKTFPGEGCAAAVFNASGGFIRKPFLDIPVDAFMAGIEISVKGGFLFAQTALPYLLKQAESSPTHPATLVFTGATASVKANPMMAAFATGKWALRALSQSLGKEYGPKGVHVAHAVIDGVIDIERTKEFMKDAGPHAKIAPSAIAEAYWHLHTQPLSCFSNEIDIRPWVEKW